MKPQKPLKTEKPALLTVEEARYLAACIAELGREAPLEDMDRYIQHGDTSCLRHCVAVAYLAYRLSRRLCPRCCSGIFPEWILRLCGMERWWASVFW